jgi:hypothetical protein
MKLDTSIKMCVNEISNKSKEVRFCLVNFLNILDYLKKKTIAAAIEYDIKQTKPNQEGLELHGTHHSLCWWWFIAQKHNTVNTDREADKKVNSDANNQNTRQNHNLKIAIKGLAKFKY